MSIVLLHDVDFGRRRDSVDSVSAEEVHIFIADELRPPWVPRQAIDPKGIQVKGRGGDFRSIDDVARHEPSELLKRMAMARAVHKCTSKYCTEQARACQDAPDCNQRWAKCVQDTCSISNEEVDQPIECVSSCMEAELLFGPVQTCLERHCDVNKVMHNRGRISDLVF